jgi:hypothetical protein
MKILIEALKAENSKPKRSMAFGCAPHQMKINAKSFLVVSSLLLWLFFFANVELVDLRVKTVSPNAHTALLGQRNSSHKRDRRETFPNQLKCAFRNNLMSEREVKSRAVIKGARDSLVASPIAFELKCLLRPSNSRCRLKKINNPARGDGVGNSRRVDGVE